MFLGVHPNRRRSIPGGLLVIGLLLLHGVRIFPTGKRAIEMNTNLSLLFLLVLLH